MNAYAKIGIKIGFAKIKPNYLRYKRSVDSESVDIGLVADGSLQGDACTVRSVVQSLLGGGTII